MSHSPHRPVFLDLLRIRLPATAITSIGHRLSGVLLFLALPVLLYWLERSLHGPQGFAEAVAFWSSDMGHLLTLALLWALAHHLFAGIRFLLADLDVGVHLPHALRSAWAVNVAALAVLLLGGLWLL